jgi:hypothetical protein
MVSSSKQFAEVSANEHSNIDHLDNRIVWLRVVVAGSFLIQILMSWRLWSGLRTFPELPLFNIFLATPLYQDITIFVVLILLLVIIMVHPKPKNYIYAVLLIVALLAISDQARWLPFFYQFYFMLAVLGFFAWQHNAQGRHLALVSCRWIVASIYFYAGLQKANVGFVNNVFPWFVEPITQLFPSTQPLLIAGGFIVPFLEMGIGVGLLVKGYRETAVILACAMHILNLCMLLVHNWGKGVLPWNASMMFFVIILFWRVEQLPLPSISLAGKLLQKSILALFVIMPAFSFFNLWDSYLSASMYSGNINSAWMYIDDSLQEKLPLEAQKYVNHQGEQTFFNHFMWSYEELGVTIPPESRIFKGIARYLCTFATHSSDVTLVIQGKPTLFRAGQPARYTCTTLGF